jgi:3-deoxy-D-manno-octulosonate 8-phosphate phosphatase (KDO 8-P phosphatase)
MDLEKEFLKNGGVFLTPAKLIGKSLAATKAFVFDWDGVFNDGSKTSNTDSSFSEIDSMGINLLRFDYWLRHGHFPLIFIITGMNNKTAAEFSQREHLDGIFLNTKNKKEALASICNSHNISDREIAFIFDDILDIEVARLSGLSFCVGRKSNPLLMDYIINNKVCNYITAFRGESHAVREICELLIGLSGDYTRALELRIQFNGEYEEYLNSRNKIITSVVKF